MLLAGIVKRDFYSSLSQAAQMLHRASTATPANEKVWLIQVSHFSLQAVSNTLPKLAEHTGNLKMGAQVLLLSIYLFVPCLSGRHTWTLSVVPRRARITLPVA